MTEAARPGLRSSWWTLLVDGAAVLVFASAGIASHDGDVLAGIVRVAWPFLAALVIVTAVASVRSVTWSLWPAGVSIWLGTVALGMVLRAVTGGGTAWSFVLVATGVLGALLLGWRVVLGLVRRARADRS